MPSVLSVSAGSRPPVRGRRLRCLLLDHDDTTVRSTEALHYPAHVESVRVLRPDLNPCSLEEWFEVNHHGISKYLNSLFTPEQMVEEEAIWRRAMETTPIEFYRGMPEVLASFKESGGKVAVISHSPANVIRKHYELAVVLTDHVKVVAMLMGLACDLWELALPAAHPLAGRIFPDLILGWDADPQRRKPSVWPALHALEQLNVPPEEALVLDDLSPGVQMGRKAGVAVAAAGWGHQVSSIQEYMRSQCEFYFSSVEEFSAFLLGSSEGPAHAAAL